MRPFIRGAPVMTQMFASIFRKRPSFKADDALQPVPSGVLMVAAALIICLCVSAVAQSGEQANENPPVSELIHMLEEREDVFNQVSISGQIEKQGRAAGPLHTVEEFELIRSGVQVKLVSRFRAIIGPRSIPEEQVANEIRLFDGNEWWYLVQPAADVKESPSVHIERDPNEALRLGSQIGEAELSLVLMQITDKPYSEYFHNISNIRLVDLENVQGFQTIVLALDTLEGRLKLWLSPEHNYAIAQAELIKDQGDTLLGDQSAPEGYFERRLATVQRFVQCDQIWVPAEITGKTTVRTLKPKPRQMRGQIQFTLDKVRVGPPEDENRAFELPSLSIGTRASFYGDTNPDGSIRFYEWNGTDFVPSGR